MNWGLSVEQTAKGPVAGMYPQSVHAPYIVCSALFGRLPGPPDGASGASAQACTRLITYYQEEK
jgi:hypothetical protein